ncbi:MAG: hypothetical protein RIM84_24275 [Alphaproteobacteria bacterium]
MAKDGGSKDRRGGQRAGGPEGQPQVISDSDVWRAAHLTIQLHGESAVEHAGRKALEMSDDGDTDGMALWMRIRTAIQALQRMQPGESEGVH